MQNILINISYFCLQNVHFFVHIKNLNKHLLRPAGYKFNMKGYMITYSILKMNHLDFEKIFFNLK